MNYIFDVIAAAIIVVCIIIGCKKGLIMTAFSLCAVVIALVLAQVLSPIAAEALSKTNLDEKTATAISSKIMDFYEEKAEPALEKTREDIIRDMKLPGFLSEYLIKADSQGVAKAESEVRKVSLAAAELTLKMISYGIIAVLVAVILMLFVSAVKLARLIPAVKKFDNFGGGIIGAALGIGIVYVLCVCTYAVALISQGGALNIIAEKSFAIALVNAVNTL